MASQPQPGMVPTYAAHGAPYPSAQPGVPYGGAPVYAPGAQPQMGMAPQGYATAMPVAIVATRDDTLGPGTRFGRVCVARNLTSPSPALSAPLVRPAALIPDESCCPFFAAAARSAERARTVARG